MEITEIKVRRLIKDGRMRALVSIVIDNSLAVHDIKVIMGQERLFVAMPSRKESDGSFRDIVHPLTSPIRELMETQILEAYYAAEASQEILESKDQEETDPLSPNEEL